MNSNTEIQKLSSSSPFYKDGFRWTFSIDGANHYAKSLDTAREFQKRIKYNISTFLTSSGQFGEVTRKTAKELKKKGIIVEKFRGKNKLAGRTKNE